jgi:hypothetical protein
VTVGSTICSSVGSVGSCGYRARMVISPASVCAFSVIAGTEVILGEISMSVSLCDPYLMRAIVRVYTMFLRFLVFQLVF